MSMSDEQSREFDVDAAEPGYEAPQVSVIGSVQELTLGAQGLNPDSDGFFSSQVN
jgi:hypothetical protein